MPDETPAVAGYTAVVYVHGMGSQRRFEETSRLIDSIDGYLANSHHGDGKSLGLLTKIKPRIEPARDGTPETFTYIRTIFRSAPGESWAASKTVRFYEVYWAAVMAGHRSPWGVLQWMLSQVTRPWTTLRSPWRERQRLRRAALMALLDVPARHPKGVEERDFKTLTLLHDAFERPDALRDYPQGNTDDFLDFIAKKSPRRPETVKRLQSLARAWFSYYRAIELKNAFTLTSLLLTLLLLGCVAVLLSFLLLQRFTDFASGFDFPGLDMLRPPTWGAALAMAASILSFLGLSKFLSDFMGDVEAWATYEETDEKHERRKKVIEKGVKSLTHVLGDPACERVAIVAHSLGTTIAHDTLLTIARLNRARNPQDPFRGPTPIGKIEHFITLGSPIDKIEYFFESYRSKSHRYRRVVEALRGDIGDAPFSRNRKPYIHWVNFWDDGDPVSGALHSPASATNFLPRIDNVHVGSLPFPKPAASHSAYFDNPDVVSELFGMIYHRQRSFQALPPRPGQDRDWRSVYLGPAVDPPGGRRFWLGLAKVLPWAALAGLIFLFLHPDWTWRPFAPLAVMLVLLSSGFLLAQRKKPKRTR